MFAGSTLVSEKLSKGTKRVRPRPSSIEMLFITVGGGGGGGGMRPIPTWNETILSCALSSWIMKIIQFFFNLNRDCFFHF